MRILISISDLRIGGAQTFAARLAQALSQNHSVYIYNYELSSHQPQDTIVNQLATNLKVIHLPHLISRLAKKVDRILANNLGFKPRVWEFIKSLHFRVMLALYKIDIVNSHMYHSDRFVTNTLHNSSFPIVMSNHGDYRYIVERGTSTVAEVLKIINRINGIVYLSDSNAEDISKYTTNFKAVAKKIYNGVFPPIQKNYSESARKQLQISENAFVFGMVARGIPEKGWAQAIQAFELVQAQTEKEMHLILVGDSNYLSFLRQSLDTKLSSVVHFIGYSSEPNYWIEGFDVGLLPTYFPGESLPNSIIEYLSLGKPVIATEVGGILEMITHQEQQAGIIIKLNLEGKADVDLLVKAMLRYVNDPVLLGQHSYSAKQAFEKFKIEPCVESYEKLFAQVMNKKNSFLN